MLKGRRFSPAMIVAMIALAVALSGDGSCRHDEADHRQPDRERHDQAG
jgi:hypothetical protein